MFKKLRLILTMCVALACVFAICVVNATTATEADFVTALTTGINADTMWGAAVPIAPLIIFTFIFAFAYMIIRRVLKKGSHGKFGM